MPVIETGKNEPFHIFTYLIKNVSPGIYDSPEADLSLTFIN